MDLVLLWGCVSNGSCGKQNSFLVFFNLTTDQADLNTLFTSRKTGKVLSYFQKYFHRFVYDAHIFGAKEDQHTSGRFSAKHTYLSEFCLNICWIQTTAVYGIQGFPEWASFILILCCQPQIFRKYESGILWRRRLYFFSVLLKTFHGFLQELYDLKLFLFHSKLRFSLFQLKILKVPILQKLWWQYCESLQILPNDILWTWECLLFSCLLCSSFATNSVRLNKKTDGSNLKY